MLDFLPFFFFSVILSLTQLFFLFLVLSTPMSSNLPPVTSFQRWQPVPATQPQPSAAILSGHTPPSLSLFLFFISPAPSLFLSRGFSIFFCLFLFFYSFFSPVACCHSSFQRLFQFGVYLRTILNCCSLSSYKIYLI